MSQQHNKDVVMLVSMIAAGKRYEAHRAYCVPSSLAAELVRERSARLVRGAPTGATPDGTWRDSLRDGDAFSWQVTVDVPHLVKPRISARYETAPMPRPARRRRRQLDEVGGDGPRVSPPQAKAIEYLVRNEANLYRVLLRALAAYAGRCRDAWDLGDAVAPRNMTAAQVSQRVAFRKIYVSRRARDGIAYLEFHGECAWDREHGFSAVLHRGRVVDVMQQGTGWTDRQSAKRPGGGEGR